MGFAAMDTGLLETQEMNKYLHYLPFGPNLNDNKNHFTQLEKNN